MPLKFFLLLFLLGVSASSAYAQGKAVYLISPVGRSEYEDKGSVDFKGKQLNLVVFTTKAGTFTDTEKIYSDPKTMLPIWVERDVTMWPMKQYLTEDYDQEKFTLVIKKYSGGKEVDKYTFDEDGPIRNAITLPFNITNLGILDPGKTLTVRVPPGEFVVKLDSTELVEVPAGKFKTYHFTSIPNKFEIWVNKDEPHIPVKIKGLGGLGYTMVLKEYDLGKK